MPLKVILKTGKTIRNNWKKSVFGCTLLGYGILYTKEYIEIQNLMRVYCQKASEYGKKSIPVHSSPRHITVILNPNANKRKAKDDFEKYCCPLLHLAGVYVEVKKTESEGHARNLVDSVEGTDAVVVAGGDGTLSEVVTGLLRNFNEDTNRLVPIGVLPLGKNNSTASAAFASGKNADKVKQLAEATLAVIEETVRPTNVMKIEILNDDAAKPVYAVNSLKWGAYRDAEARKDSYWYFGSFRKYATYIFNGFNSSLAWNCNAVIDYNLPCEGCVNCKSIPKVQHTSWLQKFVKEDNLNAKYMSILNPECPVHHEKEIITSDLVLSNATFGAANVKDPPKLVMEIGPQRVDYFEFVRNGFRLEMGEKRDVRLTIEARVVQLNPRNIEESWFSVDNEDYEVRPVKVTLLPKVINMFCKKENVL